MWHENLTSAVEYMNKANGTHIQVCVKAWTCTDLRWKKVLDEAPEDIFAINESDYWLVTALKWKMLEMEIPEQNSVMIRWNFHIERTECKK